MRNGGQQSFSLPAGTYQVSENSLPNGWKLQGATCTQGGALAGNTIQATVTGNTTTTCTFTNFLQKDNKMGDVTKLYIHERVDNLISNQPDRARILRRLEGAPAPGLKDGGSYSEPTENASGAPGSLKDGFGEVRLGQAAGPDREYGLQHHRRREGFGELGAGASRRCRSREKEAVRSRPQRRCSSIQLCCA